MKNFIFGAALAGCLALGVGMVQDPVQAQSDAFTKNRQLARTINFGNALEAPSEGAWGLTLKEEYFELAKNAGFTAIRLPVRWSAHALKVAPYTVDSSFYQRIDWAIRNATSRGLAILVNMHHYDELFADPAAHSARFLAIWKQIAARYKNQSDAVMFEPINEPNSKLEPVWNDLLAKAVSTIRETNPTRAIVVGPSGWNNITRLPELKIPDDRNLIVTVHSYEPFEFTHQGATWVNPSPPVGVSFPKPGSSLRAPWENWSWDTGLKFTDSGLDVTYQKGWAGLRFHRNEALEGAVSLSFTPSRDLKLLLACVEQQPASGNFETVPVDTKAGVPVTLNCSSRVREVLLQNATEAAVPAFTISGLELKTASGGASFESNQMQNLRDLVDSAVRWAKTRDVPIFFGEFGSFEKADMASRLRYTKFMRETFEARGISWGYWEFGSGFGIYDPLNRRWRDDLLNALIPQKK